MSCCHYCGSRLAACGPGFVLYACGLQIEGEDETHPCTADEDERS